jgi:hypothetical protein
MSERQRGDSDVNFMMLQFQIADHAIVNELGETGTLLYKKITKSRRRVNENFYGVVRNRNSPDGLQEHPSLLSERLKGF